MSETPTTLAEVNQLRRDQDLPTTVYVVGDFTRKQPTGTDVAKRAAEIVVDDGDVVEFDDRDELDVGDVLLISIPNPLPSDVGTWQTVLNIQHNSRALGLAGLVLHTNRLDANLIRFVDVRVDATSGAGVGRVEQLQENSFDPTEVYAIELEGLA